MELNNLFGDLTTDANHLIPASIWIGSILGLFLVSLCAIFVYKNTFKQGRYYYLQAWLDFVVEVVKKPFFFLFFIYCIFAGFKFAELYVPLLKKIGDHIAEAYLLGIMEFAVFFWLMLNILRIGKRRLLEWSNNTNHITLAIILPAISSSLQAALFLIMVSMVIPELGVTGLPALFFVKLSRVLLIATLGWIVFRVLTVLEKFITNQYILHNTNAITARKINTQLLILKRVILTIVFVITIAAILMVFDTFKNIGTGLLTTAGLISAVGAFASQQSLSRIFAGLQIAFTQPIRIGDSVIIDNEFGTIEEITLSYIVVKIWDLRRLIIPTDYFASKGLQNLTRESTQLLGTIFLYTDYTMPVEVVRKKFLELLDASELWDRKVAAFHVTEIKESAMELRGLMSAENSSKLFDLRCEIREKLIKYIVDNFPDCLSKSRSFTTTFIPEDEEPNPAAS